LEEALLRIYEGMFVLDDARWNENPEAVMREVRGLLEKSQAKIFVCEKWDDRKLAYPIKHRNRGIYVLARFTAPFDALRTIERDCQLNETVLRVLITRDEESERLDKLGEFPPKPGEPIAPPPPPPPPRAVVPELPPKDDRSQGPAGKEGDPEAE
jgi:small subunit ribosomal protein S6